MKNMMAELRAIQAILDRIQFKNFNYPVEFSCYLSDDRTSVVLQLHMDAIDCDSYEVGNFYTDMKVPIHTDFNEQWIIHQCRHLVKTMMSHEIDECFMVDGLKVFDPHKGEKNDVT